MVVVDPTTVGVDEVVLEEVVVDSVVVTETLDVVLVVGVVTGE